MIDALYNSADAPDGASEWITAAPSTQFRSIARGSNDTTELRCSVTSRGSVIGLNANGQLQSLALNHGEKAVGLGCGTGLNFSYLQEQVRPRGKLIGVVFKEIGLS